jgi:hypothetical protein
VTESHDLRTDDQTKRKRARTTDGQKFQQTKTDRLVFNINGSIRF